MKNIKTLTLCVLVACGAVQTVSAHTGIKVRNFTEGLGNVQAGSATAYNDFTTTHGCASNFVAEGTTTTTRLDVIGQASLFPNSGSSADVKVYRYKTGSIVANTPGVDGTVLTGVATTLPVTSPSDLTDDITGAVAGAGLNLGLGIVSPNMFGNLVIPRVDAAGAIRGYAVFKGPVGGVEEAPLTESLVSTTGLSAFKFNVPTFKSSSCAANLIVRVAVANYCTRGTATKDRGDRKDVWMGTDTGSKVYSMTGANHEVMPNSRVTLGMTDATLSEQGNGKSFWPAFTVARDLVKNPITNPACNGETYDVVVEPNGADIDKNLTIDAGKYPKAAPGAVFY